LMDDFGAPMFRLPPVSHRISHHLVYGGFLLIVEVLHCLLLSIYNNYGAYIKVNSPF